MPHQWVATGLQTQTIETARLSDRHFWHEGYDKALLAAGVDERQLFEDRASGSRDDRTGLAKALAFLKPGDCLVVWKLDRLGRSLSHLLSTVNELKGRGIGFRSLTEQMDTTTPQGEFLFHVFGALAQFERSLVQERVRAGLAAARRRGRPVVIDTEKMTAVVAALDGGATKAAVCRTFAITRSFCPYRARG